MVENAAERAFQFETASDGPGRLRRRCDSLGIGEQLGTHLHAPQRVRDGVRECHTIGVLLRAESGPVEPSGLGVHQRQHPPEMTSCRLAILRGPDVLAKLGKPARGMRGVRGREVEVDVLAPCAIVALLRDEPVAGANRRVDCALVAGMTMPRDEPAHDLRGVEHRRPCGVLGHFAARERTISQLMAQEEIDGAGGTFFETRECRLLREIEERRDEVSGRLGVGRRPSAAEAESSGHASVACRVLRAGKPAGSGQQVIFISVAGGGVAFASEDIADEDARV